MANRKSANVVAFAAPRSGEKNCRATAGGLLRACCIGLSRIERSYGHEAVDEAAIRLMDLVCDAIRRVSGRERLREVLEAMITHKAAPRR